jgi:uncharacterized ion transporter superfamily protein YfcC
VAAHVGFAGAMLNPFTIGIAQDMAGLPLFSGIEYRVVCWVILMVIAIAFVLWQASKVRKQNMVIVSALQKPNLSSQSEGACQHAVQSASQNAGPDVSPEAIAEAKGSKLRAWICFAAITISLILFAWNQGGKCANPNSLVTMGRKCTVRSILTDFHQGFHKNVYP